MRPTLRKLKNSRLLLVLEGSFVFGLAAISGCAGPTTPLGAIWELHPPTQDSPPLSQVEEEEDAAPHAAPARGLASVLSFGRDRDPKIQFDPPHQVLHGPHALKVIVDDPLGVHEGYGFEVRYHGHDVTRSFLMQARIAKLDSGSRLTLEVPSVRLSPMTEHLIEVDYTNPESGKHAFSRLKAPVCRAFESQAIQSLDEFRPDPTLMQSIEAISRQMGFNPAFAAALIAQESAFNPRSVSLARALGLTQVTPVAEEEISGIFTRWPRYPGLNGMPAPIVKWLVMRGEVNAKNEWRLNPERSIRGGLAFAQMLADRWLDSESFSKVSWTGGAGGGSADAEVARTKLILASYNSGYARVVQAINRYGAAWLTAPELKEARRYVNRIFSYCDAFERANDDEPKQERQPAALPPALIKKVMHENET